MNVVFLDRDGVINEDYGYVHCKKKFIFKDGIFETLLHLRSLNFNLIIITNQSGIGRNYYKESDFLKLNQWMLNELKAKNIDILDTFYCPHSPDQNCKCRKPKPYLFQLAIQKYNIDIEKSWMIGDKPSDIEASHAANIMNTIYVNENSLKTRINYLIEVNKIKDIINVF